MNILGLRSCTTMILKICIFLKFILFYTDIHSQIVSAVKFNDKWGFIDTTGKWHILPKFDSASSFYNGYANIYKSEREGLINQKGEIIVQPKYDFVGLVEEDMVDIMKNDKIGYINVKTLQEIQPQFEDGSEFSEGLAGVMNNNDKWGFIDNTGKLIITYKYDYINSYFENDTILVKLNSKAFYINKKDEYISDVIEKKHEKKELALHDIYIRLKIKNPGFDSLTFTSNGYRQDTLFWYKTENKFGIADTSGLAITQPIFDYIWYFSEGLAPVKQNGKWGFIFPNGKIAIDLKLEEVKNFKHGIAAAKENGKWGFIDHSGQWIIKPIYEDTDGDFRDVMTKFDPIVHYNYE